MNSKQYHLPGLDLYEDVTLFFLCGIFLEAADFVFGPDGEAGANVEAVAVIGAVNSAAMKLSHCQIAGGMGAESAESVDGVV